MFCIGLIVIFSAFSLYANSVVKKSTYDDFKTHPDYLTFEEIPTDVINAYVSIEDNTFWTNSGFDSKSILRGLAVTICSGGKNIQGGSSITQQLVKNIYLTQERTIMRKIKEVFIAAKITKKYTKKEIIEFYVNNCYYANDCYTIQSAALLYFDMPISDLTLSQCTYLCAIPNSPTKYNPLKDASAAIPRRNKILKKMFERGEITEKEYNQAINEKIIIKK